MNITRLTPLLSLALLVSLPLAAQEDVLVIASDNAVVNHYPGPDGLIGNADDVVSGNPSASQSSDPNGQGSYGFNAFAFSGMGSSDPALPTGYDAITFVQGTVTADTNVLANGGGAIVTDLNVTSGTEPFPGHGDYTSRITAVNGGTYNAQTGAFTLDVDFSYTIFGNTSSEPGVNLSGTAFYRTAAQFGSPTGNSYMDNVVIPLAQAAGAASVLFVTGSGQLTGLGYPISTTIVAMNTGGFAINPGLNDAWYYRPTSGQGFFVNVFPINGTIFLSWFTYDTERPAQNVTAILGEPGHRWLTAQGPFSGDTAVLNVFLTRGGVFDSPTPRPVTDQTPIGTITIVWTDCDTAELSYDFLGLTGTIPIERVVKDNVTLCEAFLSANPPIR